MSEKLWRAAAKLHRDSLDQTARDAIERVRRANDAIDERVIQQWERDATAERHEKLLRAQSNFRWPMHPLKPDELDSYATLDGIITPCRANAGAYTPTLGDRADFARLFPDDDEYCPPWKRMKHELRTAGHDRKEIEQWKPDDILHEIGLARAKKTVSTPATAGNADSSDDTVPPQSRGLTDAQRLTLYALATFDPSDLAKASRVVEAMPIAERRSERTTKTAIKKLVELELAERPEGKNQGARLTIKGRRLASKIAP